MRVALLRQRLIEKVPEVANSQDEAAMALALDYTRAVLVALAERSDSEDVVLRELRVKTATAARILKLHPEYVREMARQGGFEAEEENGE